MTTTDIQRPNWDYWQKRGAATIPEAVLLSLDVEPRQFGLDDMSYLYPHELARIAGIIDGKMPGCGQKFIDRIAMAKRELG